MQNLSHQAGTMICMDTLHHPECRHTIERAGPVEVSACLDCGTVEWFRRGRPVDPAEGVAAAFGNFDLIGRAVAVGAPTREVLLYRPARRTDRVAFGALPAHAWWEVLPGLWVAHDRSVLLLAPTDPVLVDNIGRTT